ncbi:MAG: AAA family ATPase [Alphaproteobacteria bacterium]|nr:AAA family ATPase [Alphaproteobacteria bacterium]
MKITYVKIENWRSIKLVEFEPADITILVGSNNAGKTNILSAINFLLGERWPMPGNLEDSHFYDGDRNRDIHISLYLDHQNYSKISFDTSRPQYCLQAFDQSGYQVRGFNNAMREEIAFAYVDAARNYERQFSLSKWTLFGQVLRSLHAGLKQDSSRLIDLRNQLKTAHELLKTEDYKIFEKELRDAFTAQLRTTKYDVKFEFQTIDETNLYRGLFPTLIEGKSPRSPTEVGSGVRNLLVLALFQAFAKTFRGNAVLGIEEPELYLHPHAQRSLMRQFDEIAEAGNQIFVSSHSPLFLDVTRSNRIILVDRKEDDDGETCTQVRTSNPKHLLEMRQHLHPTRSFTQQSLQAFLRNVQKPEMAEAFFSRICVLVEGPSEAESLPIYAQFLGYPFDENGISVVSAGGKTALDTVQHVYHAHQIPTYLIFDNDETGKADDRKYNEVLCRLLNIEETITPSPIISNDYAILKCDWETETETELEALHPGLYQTLVDEARSNLGLQPKRNKPLVARYIAQALIQRSIVPPFVVQIVEKLKEKLGDDNSSESNQLDDPFNEDIPL